MSEYIDRCSLLIHITGVKICLQGKGEWISGFHDGLKAVGEMVQNFPVADVVEVVRCQNCIHAEPFDRNCVLNSTAYMNCRMGRGEEVCNVWHKYKKYYKDYSVVDRDGFCDEGEPMDGGKDNG